MSEFMGLISGTYDAKAGGFLPGGGSLHRYIMTFRQSSIIGPYSLILQSSMMSAHGPDRSTFEAASSIPLAPQKLDPNGLAFMFETSHILTLTRWAVDQGMCGGKVLQKDYYQCWAGLEKHFDGSKEGKW